MKKYDHKKIEKKWRKHWEKEGTYTAVEDENKEKCYVLDMFPYPSGTGLHVGHPKGYIGSDIYARMKRMQGFSVLHPMGWDAFGLPAENYAIKNKIHPRDAVEKNIERFKSQLEKLGLSFDWSREINTTDPAYYKWTQWIFLELFKRGLAYESHEPINWCPSCKTGLALEDLEGGLCERCGSAVEQKPMRQWVLNIRAYADRLLDDLDTLEWPEHIKEAQRNWIGRSHGALIKFEVPKLKFQIEVFTTRPDTLFGATYLVLSPEHPQIKNWKLEIKNWNKVHEYIEHAKKKTDLERMEKKEKTGVELHGVRAINPATEEEIPVWVADYVFLHYGTGAIMAVPAHDERDFAFAKEYGLPVRDVVMPRLPDATNPHQPGKEIVHRRATINIVHDPKTDRYLTLRWKKQPWITYVTGGVEEGENLIEAARREIAEETGYTDVRFVRKLGGDAQAEFYAAHKGVSRVARNSLMLFELVSDARGEIDPKETEIHDIWWIPAADLTKTRFQHSEAEIIAARILTGVDLYEGEGILIDSGEFSGLDSREAKKKIIARYGTEKITYKLRDWVFSRQRYWGEPIPLVFCEECKKRVKDSKSQFSEGELQNPGWVAVPEEDLPVTLPDVSSYEPTGTGESPLAHISDWVSTPCPKCGGSAKRETNTMPQWAGSSWYYIAYCIRGDLASPILISKHIKSEQIQNIINYWLPVDVYEGGVEHATRHLIYARFWHKFLYDIGVVRCKEPFTQLKGVGLVYGEDGRKMSKRWGNVVNPDEIVDVYGADTLRVYEMFMGPFEEGTTWNTESIIGARRFLERIWRMGERVGGDETRILNRELESALHATVKKVTDDIETFRFNTAISALMIFTNTLEKLDFIPKVCYNTLLRLTAPFAPHVTEELWSTVVEEDKRRSSIHETPWPSHDAEKLEKDHVVIVVQIDGKVRDNFEISSAATEAAVREEALRRQAVKKMVSDKQIRKVVYVPGKLISIVTRQRSA